MREVCFSSDLQLGASSLVYPYENSNQSQNANGLYRVSSGTGYGIAPGSSVITSLSQNLTRYVDPQLPYRSLAIGVACYYSAKLTSKSRP